LQISLTPVAAEGFRPLANAYLLRGLKKGIPSLFVDVKPLYQDIRKRAIVEELVDGYRRTLEENCLPDGPSDDVTEPDYDVPTTYLWTLYFLAQHFSHIGQHSHSLSLLSSAIAHTPTLPELYTLRGRILKRLGDFVGASVAVNEARLLDGQDRFLNTKSAKYKLRAGLIEEASDTFGLFTKVSGMPLPFLLLILCILISEGCCQPWRRPGRDAVASIPYRRRKCTSTSRQITSRAKKVPRRAEGQPATLTANVNYFPLLNHRLHRYSRNLTTTNLISTDIPYESLPSTSI
jgi:hypothetical protein